MVIFFYGKRISFSIQNACAKYALKLRHTRSHAYLLNQLSNNIGTKRMDFEVQILMFYAIIFCDFHFYQGKSMIQDSDSMFTLERERWIDSGKCNMHQTVEAEILYDAIFNFYMMVRTRQCISTKVFACSLARKRQKISSFNVRECVSSSSPCS